MFKMVGWIQNPEFNPDSVNQMMIYIRKQINNTIFWIKIHNLILAHEQVFSHNKIYYWWYNKLNYFFI